MDKMNINAIRFLSSDAIDKANSGHPGLPLGAASMAYVLFDRHMRFSPSKPDWKGRDRFILSAGHGSMLLYSLLHLYKYDISLEDLKQFRQYESKTPGHPEYGVTPGVEMTTGPLGQGIATAVGFAMASKHLSAKLDSEDLFSNYTYVIAGDGDLMEGVSSESASLAASMGLNKLIVLYDSNSITIDGSTDITFTENVRDRYRAYGWNTILVKDGNNLEEISKAIDKAKDSDAPTLIEVITKIGYGSNKEGTSAVHGAPLGKEETLEMKKRAGWPEETFCVPEEVREYFDKKVLEKEAERFLWEKRYASHPNKEKIDAFFSFELEESVREELLGSLTADKATRAHSHDALNILNKNMPNLFGGSADLAASNKTSLKGEEFFSRETPEGRTINFGIREHAMAAIVNGITLYGGLRSFGATFLSFADYLKPALRLSALMEIPSVYVFTHDSIGVGEDGPTHQPIEHILMLRSVPGFRVFRPADGSETAVSYYEAFKADKPSAIVLTRQNLPHLNLDVTNAHRGAYIAVKEEGDLELILMASGSELQYAVKAAEELKGKIAIRVVSMLSMEVFNEQSDDYKEEVLPNAIRKRFAIEAASSISWDRYVGLDGKIHSVDNYACSSPANILFEKLGFTDEKIIESVKEYFFES